ncbi:hypothetical protein [Streptomyces sp. NPDC048659]|uniref:hypothetical protein n=1 Tax=Streptomyces sp. NPDC048659 TaxID=3155489 RepID=UPI003430E845
MSRPTTEQHVNGSPDEEALARHHPIRRRGSAVLSAAAVAVTLGVGGALTAPDQASDDRPHPRHACTTVQVRGGGAGACSGIGRAGDFRAKVTCRQNRVDHVRYGPRVGSGQISIGACSPLVGATVSSIGTEVHTG